MQLTGQQDPGEVAHTYTPSPWVLETQESQFQSYCQPCSNFKTNLGHRRPKNTGLSEATASRCSREQEFYHETENGDDGPLRDCYNTWTEILDQTFKNTFSLVRHNL